MEGSLNKIIDKLPIPLVIGLAIIYASIWFLKHKNLLKNKAFILILIMVFFGICAFYTTKFAWNYLDKVKEEPKTTIINMLEGQQIIIYRKPPEDEYNLKKAYSLVDEGEIKEALRLFEDFLKRHPNSWTVKSDVGFFYFREGLFEKAINLMNQVIGIVPSEAMPYYNLASMYYMINKYDKSLELANKALELNKTSSRINRLLGLIFIKKIKPNEAIEKLKIAIDKLRTMSTVNKTLLAEALADLGQAYGMNGKYELSLSTYEEAIKNDSRIARIYEGWATALFYNGDIKGAQEKIETAERQGHIVNPEIKRKISEQLKDNS